MWRAWVLAGAGGLLIGGWVGWLAMWLWQRSSAQQLHRRLRALSAASQDADPTPKTISWIRNRRYSDLPRLRQLITPLAITPRIALFLEQAGSQMNVSSYVLLHGCCALASLLLSFWVHLPIPLVAVVIGLAMATPFFLMAAKRRKRFQQLCEQLPEAIRLITSAMRAGSGLDVGLNLIASELPEPISIEFRKLSNESQLYADMNEALRHLSQRLPISDIRLFAASASLHREIGGNFVELLEQLEQTVRTRINLYRELKTLTAEGRLSGWILAALPLVVGLAISLMNPSYLRPLLEDPTGRVMLWTALGLLLVGLALIRWLTTPRLQ